MRVELAHCLPGRVRLRLPGLRGRPRDLRIVSHALTALPGARWVQVNAGSGSLLFTFDPNRLSVPVVIRNMTRLLGEEPPVHLAAAAEVAATLEQAVVRPIRPLARTGLSEREAARRQQQYGPNMLPTRPVPPFWRRFLDQFTDLPSIILLAGTALSALTGRIWEVVAVGAATGLNALIGAWREGQEDQTLAALHGLTPPHASVIREGRVAVVPAADLVPGDLVLLRAGDRVPADLVVLDAAELEVDDSRLLAADAAGPRPVGAHGLLPAGSEIARGRAQALVAATGAASSLGQIARTLGDFERLPSPVERRSARLARDLLKVALIALGVVTGVGLLRGIPPLQLLENGISLAAASVPEGLPAYMTLALAAGARRLARRGAYVRDLSTADGVGAVNVICTDKTGTLTRGEMTVRAIYTGGHWWTVTGTGFDTGGDFLREGERVKPLDDPDLRSFLETAVRCNNASLLEGPDGAMEVRGSQTEGALLIAAVKAGLPGEFGREPRLGEEPFDPARRRMTLTVRVDGGRITCSKGAPEAILPRCDRVIAGGTIRPLTGGDREQIQGAVRTMTAGGQRVLALAYAHGEEVIHGLIFAGLVGIVDPPRRELRAVIRRIERAGIRTLMLTGDHPDTAATVARELGLLHGSHELVTGAQVKQLDARQLEQVVQRTAVFARVTPEQKARVLRALQRNGDTVAYIGDGIDDAPAVQTADIGVVPRDRSAGVTREAASIILADDRFETLVTAVEQGRNTAENTDEIARNLLTANTAEILLLGASVVFGMPLALLPLQLLWINLIGDAPAALALGERHAPPEHQMTPGREPVQTLEREILVHGLQMGAAAFGLYATTLAGGASVAVARTMALSALSAGQMLHLFRCRTDLNTPCGLRVPTEPTVMVATGASALLLLASIYFPPLTGALGTAPLTMGQWLGVLGTALAGNLSTVASFSLRRRALVPSPV